MRHHDMAIPLAPSPLARAGPSAHIRHVRLVDRARIRFRIAAPILRRVLARVRHVAGGIPSSRLGFISAGWQRRPRAHAAPRVLMGLSTWELGIFRREGGRSEGSLKFKILLPSRLCFRLVIDEAGWSRPLTPELTRDDSAY